MNIPFLSKKEEKRPVWHWGEDRRITRNLWKVGNGVIEDFKTTRAFHSVQEFIMNDHVFGGLTLLVWQRDAFPKNPFRNIDSVKQQQLDDIDSIADEAGRIAKDKALEDNRRNKLLMMFTTLGYVFGITILLVLGFMIWKNGGINL